MGDKDTSQHNQSLKTPRAAGVAGIIFAALFATSIILIRLAIPEKLSSGTEWLTDGGQRISIAVMLMPFAGMATMKHKLLLIVILVVSLFLALVITGSPQSLVATAKSIDGNGALDKVPQFQKRLVAAGFSLYEGKFAYVDAVKECCEGKLKDALLDYIKYPPIKSSGSHRIPRAQNRSSIQIRSQCLCYGCVEPVAQKWNSIRS